jgi:N-acetylglutamate synthase-like GNAT family acetyltransferase
MPYTISLDPKDVDAVAIHAMLSSTYWSPGIRLDVVRQALQNSLVAVALDDQTGQIVGVARAVTDYATFAWLCDVFVQEPHRKRGLAKQMIAQLQAHPKLQTLRRWCLATRDAHSLYASLGFQPVKPGNWMETRHPESRWTAPTVAAPTASATPTA